MKCIITGAVGFIGYHLASALVKLRHTVIGIDNLSNYYDVQLKLSRLDQLKNFEQFEFVEMDILDQSELKSLFKTHQDCEIIIHLAAQPGVRYSLEHPKAYIKNNILGSTVLFETIRLKLPALKHILLGSTSSVYGNNTATPFSVNAPIDKPLSVYAASKAATELLSYSYHHLYSLPISTVRFFTVYGPYGRPDMIPYKFTHAIFEKKPITLYNHGELERDFTYIDDIINGLVALINKGYDSDHNIFNLGNTNPVKVSTFVKILEELIGIKAKIKHETAPLTEPSITFADISTSQAHFNYTPKIDLKDGLGSYVKWYKSYYHNI